MRGLRFLNEFASWRWSPTVALIGATLFYILLVLLVVPSEIALPGMNTKFVPRGSQGAGSGADAGSHSPFGAARDTSHETSGASESEPPPTPVPPAPPPQPVGNFGSRGFSPPLEREQGAPPVPPPPTPEAVPPPPAPEAPPPPAPAPTTTAENPVVVPGQAEPQAEAPNPSFQAPPQ